MTDGVDDLPVTVMESPRRGRRWWWGAAAALCAVVSFVVIWFQPQKLFIDERVDEAIPAATLPSTSAVDGPPAPSPATDPPDAAEPVELARGEFVSLDHSASGTSRVLQLADGRRIVRIERLDTSNGPDLYLYLTANPAGGDEVAFDDDYLSLGRLKGNQGDQNYDLPPDADLELFATVVIWCDRFNSAFGAADIVATGREQR